MRSPTRGEAASNTVEPAVLVIWVAPPGGGLFLCKARASYGTRLGFAPGRAVALGWALHLGELWH